MSANRTRSCFGRCRRHCEVTPHQATQLRAGGLRYTPRLANEFFRGVAFWGLSLLAGDDMRLRPSLQMWLASAALAVTGAAAADASDSELEIITVTAQKRAESDEQPLLLGRFGNLPALRISRGELFCAK